MLNYQNASALFRRNAEFLRNVATVMTGTAAAQLLSVLLTPIITRLYLPEHYGILALFVSVLHLVNQWCALCYNQAIILPKEDDEAIGLVGVAVLAIVSVAATGFIGVVIAKAAGLDLGKYEKLDIWLYLVPVLILISGLNQAMIAWNIRKKRYKTKAAAETASIAGTGGVRIAAGSILGSNVPWLIGGMITGVCIELLILIKGLKAIFVRRLIRFRMAELWQIAKKYRDFPLYNMPNNLIVSLALSLPVLVLGFLFSPAVVGLYAMTQRVINLPVGLLSLSTRKVLEQKLAELKNENKSLKGPFLKTTLGLAAISLLPALAILFFGKFLFAFALGSKWSNAGTYAVILTPWLVTSMIMQPANAVFVVMMRQKVLLSFQVCAFFLMVAGFLAAALLSFSPEMTLLLFATVRALMNVLIVARAFLYVRLLRHYAA